MTLAAAALALLLAPQNTKTRANSYDDAWESGWVAHCQTVLNAGSGKTAGFVLQVGDSITHSNPYSQWPRNRAGASAEDTALLDRILSTAGFPISNHNDPSIDNGFYLAAADTHLNRGMSAASGLMTSELLSGSGNNTTPNMPSTTGQAAAKTVVSAADYDNNLHITTLVEAFADAQFAVLMLGTNDVTNGRTAGAFLTDLTAIVDAFEGKHIAVVLSTIPPHHANDALAQQYNSQIRSFAQTRGLPLIDFYAEILARRGGNTWNGTLMQSGDVHPSASGGGFDSSSDPYASGGSNVTHTTGTSCDNVGYLLRSWLSVQKLKEVYSYVVDNTPVPGGGGGGGGGGGTPPPASSGSGDGEGDDESCSCGAAGLSAPWTLVAALLALRVRRR
jgi:hypothetical protein